MSGAQMLVTANPLVDLLGSDEADISDETPGIDVDGCVRPVGSLAAWLSSLSRFYVVFELYTPGSPPYTSIFTSRKHGMRWRHIVASSTHAAQIVQWKRRHHSIGIDCSCCSRWREDHAIFYRQLHLAVP